MASRTTNANGGRGGHHEEREHESNSQLDDSSAAMSLDESSIQLNATAAAATPLSVGAPSFASARAPRASESTSMSISGVMDTPMTLASNVNKGKGGGGNGAAAMNGGGSKARSASLKNPMPMNGDRGGEHNDGNASTSDDVAMAKNNPQQQPHQQQQQPQQQQLAADWDLERARTQLRRASRECSRRGLKLASRWASEQLMGLALPSNSHHRDAKEEEMEEEDGFLAEECCRPNDIELYAMSLFDLGEYSRAAHVLSIPTSSANDASPSPPSPDGSLGQIINPPRSNLTPLGIYLRAFSLYLEGERRKEEQLTELRDPLERTSLSNANLPCLEAELRSANAKGDLDAFGLYVYGIVLKGLRGTKNAPSRNDDAQTPQRSEGDARRSGSNDYDDAESQQGDAAHRILTRSVLMYPFNWSAWLDLGELCVEDPSIDREVEELLSPISEHWMYHFFCVHVFIENKANENAIAVIEKLANGHAAMAAVEDGDGRQRGESDAEEASTAASGFFVQSAYLQSQLAMAYYDVRDYDSAHEHFLALSEREPYRLDHMDAFSNVLYVKDQKVALSHLAHRSVTVDKYRPETCIIVGNYYSSRGRHEKAVQYFQRALKLDRNYLSAWTLLGHEYIEMKNTAAAIEAYRRAVDISDREYRAWYGLGQTYEIMNMLLHALFYFRKAAALHPHDARMWCAIGGCLLGLDRRTDAEKSYERAVSLGDGEGIATRKLAELYREDGDEEKAAKCYLRHLELRYQSQLAGSCSGPSADTSPAAFETVVTHVRVDEPEAEALLYLAYYYRDNLEYDQAILCATRLEDYPGPEKEQGKGLLRDIRSRMDRKAGEKRNQGKKSSSTTSLSTPAMGLRSRRGGDSSMDSKSAENEASFEFSP